MLPLRVDRKRPPQRARKCKSVEHSWQQNLTWWFFTTQHRWQSNKGTFEGRGLMYGTQMSECAELSMPSEIVSPARVPAIDIFRGLIMVLMALDHTRDFFTNLSFEPEALAQTNLALFATRW